MLNLKRKWVPLFAAALIVFFYGGCENPAGFGSDRAAVQPNAFIPIASADDLALIGTSGYPLNGQYQLVADITLPTTWIPPAPDSANAFSGEFDGNGHSITVTGFDQTYGGQYLGIFGYINGLGVQASIYNLSINLNCTSQIQSGASYVGGLAGYVENAVLTKLGVYGAIDYVGKSVVYLGGITGYLRKATLTGSPSGMLTFTVTSPASSVYTGGLVGYGDAAIISESVVKGTITGSGQGHNTSAGGIAGYVTNGSRVTSCTSDSTISLTAVGTGSSASDLFMIYAGGLLGYAGNGSVTSQSRATGSVTANSPYPYAGGLVGYNYGNLSGTQGSTISRCYATGEVTADATNPNPALDGLPYAGGVAGYNSGQLATIEDSYHSDGLVTATTGTGFAWAGGIVGANANNALVNRCYATGTVTAEAGEGALPFPQPQTSQGALAGGIVGYNYFTETTTVQACFGLTGLITGIQTDTPPVIELRRVVGRNGAGGTYPLPAIGPNYGSTAMAFSPTRTPVSNLYDEDGGNCLPQPSQTDFANQGWDFSTVWKMTGPYPTLQWEP